MVCSERRGRRRAAMGAPSDGARARTADQWRNLSWYVAGPIVAAEVDDHRASHDRAPASGLSP